jgi:glyoxylase I family protein
VLRLDHLVFPIWDVEKSIAFYRDLLGLKLVDSCEGDDWGGFPWLMLIFALADKREVVLVALKGAKRPPADQLPKDVRHLAFAESGSLDIWRDRLGEAEVDFWEEDHGDQQSLYFSDPNGVTLEIASRPAARACAQSASALTRALKWVKQAS